MDRRSVEFQLGQPTAPPALVHVLRHTAVGHTAVGRIADYFIAKAFGRLHPTHRHRSLPHAALDKTATATLIGEPHPSHQTPPTHRPLPSMLSPRCNSYTPGARRADSSLPLSKAALPPARWR